MRHFTSRETGVVWLKGLASGGKLNLHRDLLWLTKRTGSSLTSSRKSQKTLQNPSSHALFHALNLGVAQLALTWVGRPNAEKLPSICVQI